MSSRGKGHLKHFDLTGSAVEELALLVLIVRVRVHLNSERDAFLSPVLLRRELRTDAVHL